MLLRKVFTTAVLLLLVNLAGCAVPYSKQPGYYGSRADFEQAVSALFVDGKTTREDVLAALGRPEVAATDDRWFYYESDYLQRESGAWVAFGIAGAGLAGPWPTSQSILFKRLYVAFAANGLVTATTFNKQECKEITHPGLGRGDYRTMSQLLTQKQLISCALLQRDLELRDRRLVQRWQDTGGDVASAHVRYNRALWKDGLAGNWGSTGFSCRFGYQPSGTIFISQDALTYLPPETRFSGPAPSAVRLTMSEIEAVKLLEPSMNFLKEVYGIEIQKRDGLVAALTLCDTDYDQPNIRKAYLQLREGTR